MIRYVQQQYAADPDRVYATGSSSSGMMTNHMLALYPDIFKARATFMGVPYNCFLNAADYPPPNSQCTNGTMNRTPQQWGDAVRQVNPGYSGPARACSCGTAPATHSCRSHCSRRRSTSGPTCSG